MASRKKSAKNKENEEQKSKKELYRIIITSQNKIMVCVFKTLYKKSALFAFEKILKENKKNIRFPIKYSSRDHRLMESKYELLLMKTKSDGDSDKTLLRNEYGQLVPHISNSSKMIIYKKEKYLFEESFWVYGFNPKSQRKNFNYILHEIVLKNLPNVKYPIKNIIIYNNKLLIQTENDFDIIICKCENDAARLYTELEKEIYKMKIKSIMFSGLSKNVVRERIEESIAKKTGWEIKKIRQKSTRP